MSKILEEIKIAEKGSDMYSLIERIAENVKQETPENSDDYNWFEAQRRINKFLLEDKLAERISLTYPEKKYDSCLEEAREILNKIDLDKESIEEIAHEGIPIDKLIECNLKYYSNQFYIHRKNQDSSSIDKKFDDWKKAIICVSDNISFY